MIARHRFGGAGGGSDPPISAGMQVKGRWPVARPPLADHAVMLMCDICGLWAENFE